MTKTSENTEPTFHYARVVNSDDVVEGYFYSPVALTQKVWDRGEDFDCCAADMEEKSGAWWDVDEDTKQPTRWTRHLSRMYELGVMHLMSSILSHVTNGMYINIAPKPSNVPDDEMAIINIT